MKHVSVLSPCITQLDGGLGRATPNRVAFFDAAYHLVHLFLTRLFPGIGNNPPCILQIQESHSSRGSEVRIVQILPQLPNFLGFPAISGRHRPCRAVE